MPVLAPEQALKEVKQKKIQPLYLIHGDESYYVDLLADEIEKVAIPEAEKAFNQVVLYGKEADLGKILNAARRFPFMAERQLVLVKEAQQIKELENKDLNKLLDDYASRPLSSTILVLCYKGSFDARKSLYKTFEKQGVVVQCKKMYDNKLPDWVGEYTRAQGTKISIKAIQMLVEYIGNDLKRLTSEIDKILINLKASEEITAAIVEKYVGISKEYNVFELQKALTQRDVVKSNQIAQYLAANPKENPLPQVLIILYNFFSKTLVVHATKDKSEGNLASVLGVNPFFVKDYLAAARQYPLPQVANVIKALRLADNASKGIEAGSSDENAILRELVFRILH
ncbi:MAG: DNA polymerase III subunit delta [Spirosomaceae bacterium]|jgi:DNA polymerase-3 subunit delta|nr:DNA polymerase III subunit delta [Spirosomataceae bacterium]